MKILTVPIVFAQAIVDAAVRKGCDRDEVTSACGLSSALLAENNARISSESYAALCAYVTAKIDDEACGLQAEPVKVGTFEMMCYACINCPTLGEFLKRGTEFNRLVSNNSMLELVNEGQSVRYRCTLSGSTVTPHNNNDPNNILPLSILAIAHRLASWLVGKTVALESANFSHARPDCASAYNYLFKSPVRFSSADYSLVFAASYLDLPIQQNEQSLALFLQTPSMSLLVDVDEKNSYVGQISHLIHRSVATEFPDFEWVAEQLLTTTGTLRRRLRDEGTSYQQLKDDIRRDTAIYNLNKGTMSLENVADSVGFSEPTSFFRAFKRWTGVTPRSYLKSDEVLAQ